MNCEIALDRMLEAEPAELRGELDTDLARHLSQCARCHAVAEEIVAGEARLASGLRALQPSREVDAVVRRVKARPRFARQVIRSKIRLVPLAAAAALALLLFRADRSREFDGTVTPTALPSAGPPAVQVSPNTNFVLMKTDNPKITVLWFY